MNELTVLSTDPQLKDTEKVYTCQFVNSRRTWVSVFEFERLLFKLEPGGEFLVEMWSPDTTYAPFSRIEFLSGDKVAVKRNPAWKLPINRLGKYPLELLNEAGAPVEAFYPVAPNETPLVCYRGIPRYIAIGLDSRYIRYQRISWQLIKEKVPDRNNPDFLVWQTRVEQVKELRSKSELAEIEAEIKRRAKEQAEKATESLRKQA